MYIHIYVYKCIIYMNTFYTLINKRVEIYRHANQIVRGMLDLLVVKCLTDADNYVYNSISIYVYKYTH